MPLLTQRSGQCIERYTAQLVLMHRTSSGGELYEVLHWGWEAYDCSLEGGGGRRMTVALKEGVGRLGRLGGIA